jgi:hypothetical protein
MVQQATQTKSSKTVFIKRDALNEVRKVYSGKLRLHSLKEMFTVFEFLE